MLTYSIFCGVNGAGKTTLYDYLKISGCSFGENINPDEILKNFGGNWQSWQDGIRSAVSTREKIKYCLQNKISFSRETTILTEGTLEEIKKAISQGFKVNLYFIGIDNYDLTLERIANRVNHGGHGIPEFLVKQRFDNQFNNLNNAIKLSTNSFLFDNESSFSVAAIYSLGKQTYANDSISWLKKINNTAHLQIQN